MDENLKRFVDDLITRYEETKNGVYAETLVLFYSTIAIERPDGIKQYCLDKLQACRDTYVQAFLEALNEA